jgi:hypothetical protein
MKTVFNYRNIAIALFTVLTVAIAPATHATDDKNNTATVELKFIGNFRNNPVFELNITNPGTENEFVINIRDEFGNSLYREALSSNTISKKFLLNAEEIGDDKVRFEITSRKTNKTIVYEINQSTRIVDEVSVTKVN